MHKLKKYFFVSLIAIILYWPVKYAKYHLFDLSYQEIIEFSWRNRNCSLSDTSKCSCHSFIEPDDSFTITDDGDLYFENRLYGKLILKNKPNFIATKIGSFGEILTGGLMEIIRPETGVICYYDSI